MARPWPSPDAVRIEPVETRDGERAFRELPYRLYRGDPRWVAPLRFEERRRWSPRHNASLGPRWVRRFLARRGPRVVGRVAALVDRAFADRWEPGTGLFGFFECADDEQAVAALLGAAQDALRAQGMGRILGPVNLTPHDETGVLVEGFESPPMVLSPYNPPYYARLLERAGLLAYRDYHSYLATPRNEPGPAVQRLLRAAGANRGCARGVTVRPLNLRRWEAELRAVCDLYNASFADVWGFVPIGWDEFRERAERFRPFVVADLVLVAEEDGAPVGVALTLPDVNRALAPLGGRLLPFGWLRLARAIPKIRTARFILLGVRPSHMGRGIGALLAVETLRAVQRLRVERLELSLVQAANHRVRAIIDAFGCPRLKTFRLYAKPI